MIASQVLPSLPAAQGHVHIYQGAVLRRRDQSWRVWLHNPSLGEFDEFDAAKRAVAEWCYGPLPQVQMRLDRSGGIMRAQKITAVVVTQAPPTEVRFAAAAHDFCFAVEPAAAQYPVGTASARCYQGVLANGAVPRPNIARTVLAELSLWSGTIVYDLA
jgi:hypothetical protein